MKLGSIVLLVIVIIGVMLGVSSYNGLISLDQQVQSQWGQVQNVYQRRADLIPNLVETVKGAAAFERETYVAVAEARSRVGQTSLPPSVTSDPQKFQDFQQKQDALGSALSRLLVVAERYPELKATEAFRDLQSQLEGTENRIAVERMRYNDAARAFNSKRNSFPTVLLAGLFGERFREKQYFQAQAGAETAPKVKF